MSLRLTLYIMRSHFTSFAVAGACKFQYLALAFWKFDKFGRSEETWSNKQMTITKGNFPKVGGGSSTCKLPYAQRLLANKEHVVFFEMFHIFLDLPHEEEQEAV